MSRRFFLPVLVPPALLLAFALLTPTLPAGGGEPKVKDAEWKHGLELRVRKSSEEEFGKGTKKYGVEVFVDENNGNGVYISETGSIAAVAGKLFKPSVDKVKDPLFTHGLALAARRAAEKEFSKATKKFGVEVFRDENNGNLIYIGEGGAIDVVPGRYAGEKPAKVRPPEHLYGMNVKVRKAGEKDWKEARRFGVEVFKDDNNGNLVYITETGSFAVAPGALVDRAEAVKKGKDPEWMHGLELDVRKAGEAEFKKDTKRYGLEVYRDENNGCLVYITETGDIAVVPSKLARATEGKSKSPELKHALELAARKAGEAEFKSAKRYGVEVYNDENNGCTIYITETGDITVVPGKEA